MIRLVAVGGPFAGQIITAVDGATEVVLRQTLRPGDTPTDHVYKISHFARTETKCWLYQGARKGKG